jgi:hypothetical protein
MCELVQTILAGKVRYIFGFFCAKSTIAARSWRVCDYGRDQLLPGSVSGAVERE